MSSSLNIIDNKKATKKWLLWEKNKSFFDFAFSEHNPSR